MAWIIIGVELAVLLTLGARRAFRNISVNSSLGEP